MKDKMIIDWLDGLKIAYLRVDSSQGQEKTDFLNQLLGYLDTIDTILEIIKR